MLGQPVAGRTSRIGAKRNSFSSRRSTRSSRTGGRCAPTEEPNLFREKREVLTETVILRTRSYSILNECKREKHLNTNPPLVH